MNLKKGIGQLFIIGFRGQELTPGSRLEYDIAEGNQGGVILFDRCLSEPKAGNIKSPKQLQQLITALQSKASTPLLICADQEGGKVQRLNPGNGFPGSASAGTMGAADSSDDFTLTQAEQTARMLETAGINVNFAPVIDLNTNRTNPIIGGVERSFSAVPSAVIHHAEIWIRCHRNHNIISCLKHFPGHGSSTSDSHLGFVDISSSWQKKELVPYRQLISRGLADTIMVGHLFNNTIDPDFPATLSHLTITDLLRRKLGYKGVILTDDMQMKAITDHYGFEEALCRSFAAGIDMIVIGNNLQYNPKLFSEAVNAVLAGVKQGIVTEERLISALDRVRHLKQGLQTKM